MSPENNFGRNLLLACLSGAIPALFVCVFMFFQIRGQFDSLKNEKTRFREQIENDRKNFEAQIKDEQRRLVLEIKEEYIQEMRKEKVAVYLKAWELYEESLDKLMQHKDTYDENDRLVEYIRNNVLLFDEELYNAYWDYLFLTAGGPKCYFPFIDANSTASDIKKHCGEAKNITKEVDYNQKQIFDLSKKELGMEQYKKGLILSPNSR